jgi:hypothetical protein
VGDQPADMAAPVDTRLAHARTFRRTGQWGERECRIRSELSGVGGRCRIVGGDSVGPALGPPALRPVRLGREPAKAGPRW